MDKLFYRYYYEMMNICSNSYMVGKLLREESVVFTSLKVRDLDRAEEAIQFWGPAGRGDLSAADCTELLQGLMNYFDIDQVPIEIYPLEGEG